MTQFCIDILQDESKSNEKCKLLAKCHKEALDCEKISVSNHSPDIVGENESVARQIISPIHYDEETGEVTIAAFDDVLNKGLSVNRLSYREKTEIHLLGKAKAERDRLKKPERQYLGFVSAKVSKIRSDCEGSFRVFAVYDTGLEDVSDHADVCALLMTGDNSQSPPLPKKVAKMRRRMRLKKIFCEFVRSE